MPDESKPDTRSKSQADQLAAVQLCRDVYDGTFRMRERASEYLPQWPMEPKDSYSVRVKTAEMWEGFARTVEGLVGMVCGKDPVLGDDVPAAIAGDRKDKNAGGHFENLDNKGTHGDVWIADRLADAIVDGHVVIMVDMPVKPEGAITLDDDRRLALRPYWIDIKKSAVLRAQTSRVGGRNMLTRFAYLETVTEPDGKFGEKETKQVRDYELVDGKVTFAVWKKVDASADGKIAEHWEPGPSGTLPIREIPVTVAYGGRRVADFVSKPPLESLAHLNAGHFRRQSGFHNSLHIASVPIPYATGVSPDDFTKMRASPSAVMCFEEPNAELAYLEPTGVALESAREDLQDTVRLMATLGLAMLQARDVQETAEGKRIDKSASDSALARCARNMQDAVEEALRFHAMWINEKDGGSFTINRQFERLVLSSGDVDTLLSMVVAKKLSVETMWARLLNGGWLDDSFDEMVERDRLEQEALKNPPMDPIAAIAAATGGGRFGRKPADPAKGDPEKPEGDPDPTVKK